MDSSKYLKLMAGFLEFLERLTKGRVKKKWRGGRGSHFPLFFCSKWPKNHSKAS